LVPERIDGISGLLNEFGSRQRHLKPGGQEAGPIDDVRPAPIKISAVGEGQSRRKGAIEFPSFVNTGQRNLG
jgi:hypothetical protein